MRNTLVACLLAALSAVAMANRDSGWQQQASEQQLADDMATCDADPKCVKLRNSIQRGMEQRKAQADIAYEQKPFIDKAVPWLVIVGVVYLLWRWIDSAPGKKE